MERNGQKKKKRFKQCSYFFSFQSTVSIRGAVVFVVSFTLQFEIFPSNANANISLALLRFLSRWNKKAKNKSAASTTTDEHQWNIMAQMAIDFGVHMCYVRIRYHAYVYYIDFWINRVKIKNHTIFMNITHLPSLSVARPAKAESAPQKTMQYI